MEWAPLSGSVPPWSQAEWQRLFDLYQQIPQYQLMNQGFGMDGFKHIFWLEWTHRLWGRLIGVVFLVPLVVLGLRGAIRRGLWLRLAGLFVLGGLQGAVGWFMVASGFAADSTAVSAYRLVAHLTLALLLYGAILWTALGVLRPGRPACSSGAALRPLASRRAGPVAGDDRRGRLRRRAACRADLQHLPDDGRRRGAARLRRAAPVHAQPDREPRRGAVRPPPAGDPHGRSWSRCGRRADPSQPAPGGADRGAAAWALAVVAQYALGVATLLWVVPVGLAAAHQGVAILLLTATS